MLGVEGGKLCRSFAHFLLWHGAGGKGSSAAGWERTFLELILSLLWESVILEWGEIAIQGWVLCHLPFPHQLTGSLSLALSADSVGTDEKIDIFGELRWCLSPRTFLCCSFILSTVSQKIALATPKVSEPAISLSVSDRCTALINIYILWRFSLTQEVMWIAMSTWALEEPGIHTLQWVQNW